MEFENNKTLEEMKRIFREVIEVDTGITDPEIVDKAWDYWLDSDSSNYMMESDIVNYILKSYMSKTKFEKDKSESIAESNTPGKREKYFPNDNEIDFEL